MRLPGLFCFVRYMFGWFGWKSEERGVFGNFLKNEGDFEWIGQFIGQFENGVLVEFAGVRGKVWLKYKIRKWKLRKGTSE